MSSDRVSPFEDLRRNSFSSVLPELEEGYEHLPNKVRKSSLLSVLSGTSKVDRDGKSFTDVASKLKSDMAFLEETVVTLRNYQVDLHKVQMKIDQSKLSSKGKNDSAERQKLLRDICQAQVKYKRVEDERILLEETLSLADMCTKRPSKKESIRENIRSLLRSEDHQSPQAQMEISMFKSALSMASSSVALADGRRKLESLKKSEGHVRVSLKKLEDKLERLHRRHMGSSHVSRGVIALADSERAMLERELHSLEQKHRELMKVIGKKERYLAAGGNISSMARIQEIVDKLHADEKALLSEIRRTRDILNPEQEPSENDTSEDSDSELSERKKFLEGMIEEVTSILHVAFPDGDYHNRMSFASRSPSSGSRKTQPKVPPVPPRKDENHANGLGGRGHSIPRPDKRGVGDEGKPNSRLTATSVEALSDYVVALEPVSLKNICDARNSGSSPSGSPPALSDTFNAGGISESVLPMSSSMRGTSDSQRDSDPRMSLDARVDGCGKSRKERGSADPEASDAVVHEPGGSMIGDSMRRLEHVNESGKSPQKKFSPPLLSSSLLETTAAAVDSLFELSPRSKKIPSNGLYATSRSDDIDFPALPKEEKGISSMEVPTQPEGMASNDNSIIHVPSNGLPKTQDTVNKSECGECTTNRKTVMSLVGEMEVLIEQMETLQQELIQERRARSEEHDLARNNNRSLRRTLNTFTPSTDLSELITTDGGDPMVDTARIAVKLDEEVLKLVEIHTHHQSKLSPPTQHPSPPSNMRKRDAAVQSPPRLAEISLDSPRQEFDQSVFRVGKNGEIYTPVHLIPRRVGLYILKNFPLHVLHVVTAIVLAILLLGCLYYIYIIYWVGDSTTLGYESGLVPT